MRKKSRRTGSVYCWEVINTRPGQAGSATATPRVPPLSPWVWASHRSHPKICIQESLVGLKSSPWASLCVCLGPSKSNIPPDLCAPGSLCTPRQTGIFSGVCSHSRKNSQMGITLPRGTGWMSFIYNAGQNEELLSAALLLSSLSTRSCDFLVSALLCSEFGDRNVRSVVLDTNGSFPEATQILSNHQNVRSKTCQGFCISSKWFCHHPNPNLLHHF